MIDRRIHEAVVSLGIAAGGYETGIGFDRAFALLRHADAKLLLVARLRGADIYVRTRRKRQPLDPAI